MTRESGLLDVMAILKFEHPISTGWLELECASKIFLLPHLCAHRAGLHFSQVVFLLNMESTIGSAREMLAQAL